MDQLDEKQRRLFREVHAQECVNAYPPRLSFFFHFFSHTPIAFSSFSLFFSSCFDRMSLNNLLKSPFHMQASYSLYHPLFSLNLYPLFPLPPHHMLYADFLTSSTQHVLLHLSFLFFLLHSFISAPPPHLYFFICSTIYSI